MTPAGRVQAAIDLIQRIETPDLGKDDTPADVMVSGYFRGRRYIGSKDRRAIGDMVYGALRARAALDWRAGGLLDVRARMLGTLSRSLGWSAKEVDAAFDGSRHGPAPLVERERELLNKIDAGEDIDEAPLWVRANIPEWLADDWCAGLEDRGEAEAEALRHAAPVDLRVNALKATRDQVAAALAAAGLAPEPTPHSPVGLRLAGRAPLAQLPAYRDGLFEIQDEGSQLAALMVDARPGMAVLDLCAGAGGKSLAIAAAMANEGRILATDTDARRLGQLLKRAQRAGARIIDTRAVPEDGSADLGQFDRVLVDAPCSGSGTWRRHPEAAWRLTPDRLEAYRETQRGLLDHAAVCVAPGGRLVYVTCSLLGSENAAQADAFLARNGEFRQLPAFSVWSDVVKESCPVQGDALLLSPHRTATDGFFVAIMERIT